jgi:diguanylate cyclase (GGDEF)-like protein
VNAPPLRLATQLALVLCAVSALTTAMVLSLQERSLSSELERAAQDRLARSAVAADRLLDAHLATMADRWDAISQTPEFRANLEIDDGPTLGFFAKQLAVQQDATLIQFLDAQSRPRVRSGDKALGRAARARLAQGDAPDARSTRLLAHEGVLHAMSVTPLRSRGRLAGRLLALEPITERTLREWSELCGARVYFGPTGDGPAQLDVVLRGFGDLALRVAGSLDAEHAALQRSRRRLLVAGVIALALAFGMSFPLARRLARPILEFQHATERIARGDLDVRLGDVRGDEIGDVARAFNDMTDRLRTTLGEVRYLAYHDSLTGLGNRVLFEEHLNLALEQARRSGRDVAVLFVDLDHFKYVNDTLGHGLGDQLLKEMADRILTCLERASLRVQGRMHGEAARVARFGGDEFTVLLSGLSDPQLAGSVARAVLEALAEPFHLGSQEVSVGASIGISVFPEDGSDADTLLRNCDTAMYHAKQQGRNRYQFFARYMNEIATKRLVLEAKLRRAIDSGQLRLHYQPKVELATGRVVGLEALARWREPELGSIPPDEFVPLAEESGLIHGMGDWVLRTAIAQLAAWQDDGRPPLRVAVNLSAQQLQRPGLVERISSLLEEGGVAPEWLEVEVTESVLLEDEEGVIAILEALRSLGVHVSLDDFGTGYSSLSYLRRLPIDTVKIDQSFVRAVEEEAEDAAITQAMISLVKVLHLRVVVEGVETEAQRAFLHEVGCDEIQGFLVSAPVAPEEVSQLVETIHRKKRLRRRRRK